ncbi:MAG: class I SAM-dependent methyltransferase [Abitibacteriaceae bacterium]|nr:class I SAM-dependent methyltransferase [Abditibacteriaceae bacterium]
MFTQSAWFYDAVYSWKDYAGEVEWLHAFIQAHDPQTRTLLDVACGTGKHLEFLRSYYQVEGVDLNKELLKIAHERLPDVPVHQGNMMDFQLGHSFDVVTCLFSSIGYVKTVENLQRAINNMSHHLEPGGLMLVEPWFHPTTYYPGTLHAGFVNDPDLKIARMNVSGIEGHISVMEMHYLVGTPEGIEHFTERHELALFTHEEYLTAFHNAGLEVHHEADGLTGRGLYIGVRK